MAKEPIEIVYNGKQFKQLERAKIDDEEKLVTQAMALNVEAALAPLKPEIEEEGGAVTIDIKGPTMFQIATKHLSEGLTEKVRKALTPAG